LSQNQHSLNAMQGLLES